MSGDSRESAYWGDIKVTPEREAAWQQWKDNYLATCVDGWIAQGAVTDEIYQGAAVVMHDLGKVEALPWMKLGEALVARMGAVMLDEGKPLVGDRQTEYINALRTAETSTEHERTLALAYHLGVTVQHAASMRERAKKDADREPETTGRTALYRHFDASGVLLYIGVTVAPDKRADQHRYNSAWFRFVDSTDVEWFETSAEAYAAERETIKVERPIFNDTHNKNNRDAAIAYLFGALDSTGVVA